MVIPVHGLFFTVTYALDKLLLICNVHTLVELIDKN